ncbi:MAG: SLC5 family protein, partial [Luminiphilus sp.]|nr:SLC5 family protein [Luminiphilus sp.]
MPIQTIQILVFVALTALIAGLTWRHCAKDTARRAPGTSTRDDVFLAGRGLSWIVVAGSITLTNLST